ncbi:MAG: tetratricopeptide repeat protein [Pyrinomonadaceae bacterium]
MKTNLSLLVIASFFFALLPLPSSVAAQDLVATNDIAGGSSVFVFRGSRKAPQARAGGGKASLGEGGGRVGGGSKAASGQIAALAKKRRADAIAARKKAAIAAANKKIASSNMLTAKAETAFDNDQTDLAITNYRAALVQNPKNTRASEGLSNALTAKGIDVAGDTNNEAAIALFEEAVKYDKQNDVAYAKAGAIYDANGKNEKAVLNYEKALAINPAYTMLYPPLGVSYLNSGEIAKAESALQKAEAGGIDTVETRQLRGVILFKQNKNTEALAAFDRALELDGNFASAQYYRGQTFDRMERPDDAIAAYKKTLEIDPANSAASFDMGVAYYNKGDYPNAAAAYQQTLKYDPNNAQAHANLASTYRQQERYVDANAEYKAASEKGMKTADMESEWGFCLGKTAEWEKAVARLESARVMSPGAVDNNNVGWAYYNAGYTQKAAKNDAAATENYEKGKVALKEALVQEPQFDAAYVNLGATHNELGEHQEAVEALKTADKLHPNWNVAINQLGRAFRGLKDFVNAIANFKRVVDTDGSSINGLFNLGEAYNASGNKKEAKKMYDRLKKIDPNMALRLDNIFNGKAQIDAAKQKIENKIPKLPRFP